MSAPIRRPLVLDSPEFSARAENFANLMNVPEFQERFFRDPSGTAAEEFGLQATTVTLSRANQFTYALLADPAFNTWAMDFQARAAATLKSNTEGLPSLAEMQEVKSQLIQDFIESVQAHLDPETVDIVRELHPGVIVAEPNIAAVPLVFVVIVVVVTVAAGVMKADEVLSRKTVQLLIRRLDEQQVAQIATGRALNA